MKPTDDKPGFRKKKVLPVPELVRPGQSRPSEIISVLDGVHDPGFNEKTAVGRAGHQRDPGFRKSEPKKADGGQGDQ